jgi:predicted transcriptional regulator
MTGIEVRPAKFEKVFKTRSGHWPILPVGISRVMQSLPREAFSRTLAFMEVLFTAELEAKLARSAAEQGRNPDELVQQVVAQYFDEESRIIDAVSRGEKALLAGEYLTHEQVGQRLERFLRP